MISRTRRNPLQSMIATVKQNTACPEGSSQFMGNTILTIIWRPFFSWDFILHSLARIPEDSSGMSIDAQVHPDAGLDQWPNGDGNFHVHDCRSISASGLSWSDLYRAWLQSCGILDDRRYHPCYYRYCLHVLVKSWMLDESLWIVEKEVSKLIYSNLLENSL